MSHAPGEEPTDLETGWQHLHPLSPILRGGIATLAVLGYLLSQLVDDLMRSVTGSGEDPGAPGSGGDPVEAILTHRLLALGVLVLVLAGIVGVGWLSWRFSRFRVSESQVELRTGWLFRQHRQVPLERIQSVEVSRPLLAQLLGLSRVVVQSAGGDDSQLSLSFLGKERADAVRDELLVLAGRTDERARRQAAAGASAAGGALPPTDGGTLPTTDGDVLAGPGGTAYDPRAGGLAQPGRVGSRAETLVRDIVTGGPDAGRPVLAVPNGRLFVATALHGSTIVLGLFALLAAGAVGAQVESRWGFLVGVGAALPGLLPVALGVGLNRAREMLQHGNFRMSDLGASLRIRHGLTDQRTTTIPLHRVQALELSQSLWWRPFGWWRAMVNVAGTPSGEGQEAAATALLPVGSLEDVLRVMALVDERLDLDLLRDAATGDGDGGGRWRLVSPRARFIDPISYRRNGYAVTDHTLLVRHGRLWRVATVVPHARIQSMTLDQGPVERPLGLARVQLHSTVGPVSPQVEHLTLADAEELLARESERASRARARV